MSNGLLVKVPRFHSNAVFLNSLSMYFWFWFNLKPEKCIHTPKKVKNIGIEFDILFKSAIYNFRGA